MRPYTTLAAALLVISAAANPIAARENPGPHSYLYGAEEAFRRAQQSGQDEVQSRDSYKLAAIKYGYILYFDQPDLFLNCGNAHVLADELPQAILVYRQGLRLHPLHPQLNENLEAARDLVAYPNGDARHRPAADAWPWFLPRWCPECVLHTALILHGFAWLALLTWLILRRRPTGIITVVLFLATAAAVGWWFYLDYRIARDTEQPLVVVRVNGAALRRGNGSMYPRLTEMPTVNRGMEGRLLHERGGWVQVQFAAGEIGWLPRGAVITE
jgi:hypothetical protein